jgi:hypothetical protein
MALDTRAVLAIIGVLVLSVGILLHAAGRESAGLGLFAIGFGASAGWSFIGMELSQQGRSAAPAETYLATGMAALSLALYFGLRTHASLYDRR